MMTVSLWRHTSPRSVFISTFEPSDLVSTYACVCVLRVYGDGGREQGTRAGTRRRRNSATRCHVLSQHIMPARTGARH